MYTTTKDSLRKMENYHNAQLSLGASLLLDAGMPQR